MKTDKILIAGFCGVGDLLFFLPSLDRLREVFPNAKIDLLSLPGGIDEVLKSSGLINDFIHFPFEKYVSDEKKDLRYVEIIRAIFAIRKAKYDIIIWPFAYTTLKKKILAFLFAPRVNIMHFTKRSVIDGILLSNARWIPFIKGTHSVKLNQALLEPLGIKTTNDKIKIVLSKKDVNFSKQFLERLSGGRKRFFLGVQPGGKLLWNPYRQWEVKKFAALADKVSQNYDAITLIFGTKSERKILEEMAGLMKTDYSIVDELTLREVFCVINEMDLFMGNDSALVHIAASLGKRAISVTGATNFERTAPWGEQSYVARLNLECSPCFDLDFTPHCPHRICLKKLEPDFIFSVIKMILDSGSQERKDFSAVVYNNDVSFDFEKEYPGFLKVRKNWEDKRKASN